jgi:hypothetical protein
MNTETFTVPGVGEKRLHEMTAAEVLTALNWHDAEAERLKREADRLEARVRRELGGMTLGELKATIDAMEAANEAGLKSIRLGEALIAQCPPRYADVPLKDGLPRWWGS